MKLNLEVRMNEDVAVVACKGRIIYHDEVAALSCIVSDLLPRARQLVLELSEVESMDGAGLGGLLAMRARARARGCSIELAAPSKNIRELLELTGVVSAFEIYATVNDALCGAQARAHAG